MTRERAVVLLAALVIFGVSQTDGLSCQQGSSADDDLANGNCTGAETFCGKNETTDNMGMTATVASCQADAAACDGLCMGTAGCVSACCNVDNCNTATVAEIRNVVTCMTGTVTGMTLTATTACEAGQLCGRKQTTAAVGGAVTTVGSCATQAQCDLLCSGVTDTCISACCNDADNCNGGVIADVNDILRCGTGSTTDGNLPAYMTCASTQQCGRTETSVTTDGNTVVTTVGSCETTSDCGGDLCNSTDGCVAACCNDADNCNTLTIAVTTGRVCMVGTTSTVGNGNPTGSLVATHCNPNMFCGRTQTTTTANNMDTVVVEGSCQASADSCDLLCADDSNCVRACCNDADNCNSVSVAMMTRMLTCHTGTVSGTTLTATTDCTTPNHVCARRETTTGTGDSATVETIGSCQAQSACAALCDSIQNCVSACCSSSDLCNSLTVSQQTARNCYVGSSTSDTPVMDMTYTRCAASEQCGRTQTSVTSGSTTTVTTEGSCTAASTCDTLCGTAANCVSTCCDTDGCNSAAVTTTTTTTTTAATTTTTSGAEHAAQINMLVMMGLVVLGWFMA